MEPSKLQSKIEDLSKKVAVTAKKYRDLGTLNEQFASGQQWGAVSITGGAYPVLTQDDWMTGLPRVWSNRSAGLLQSWAALISGDQPTAAARAASQDPVDAYRADIANKVLAYLRQRLSTTEKVSQSVRFAGLHGTAGLRCAYDADKDELRLDSLTIFDYVRDPTYDYRESRWVIFRTWVSEDDARRRLKRATKDMDPNLEKRTNSLGEQIEGVSLVEYYAKPCSDYPGGVYAALVGDELVETIPNPFYFDIKGKREYILPFFLMKVRDQRDSPYGATPFTDLIPLQRSLNECIAQNLHMQRLSMPSIVLPKSIAAQYTPGQTTTLEFDLGQEEGAKEIRWTQPAPVDSKLTFNLELYINEMMAVIGLNDTAAGNAQRAQSGAAIDSLLALDKQKNADCTTSMKMMVLDAFKFMLLCVAALYSDEKKMEIAAATKAAVDMFDESDIGGVDVQLQVDSEVTDLGLGKDRQVGSGLGLVEGRQIVQDYLAGADVLHDPSSVDAAGLQQAIEEAKSEALAAGDRETFTALAALQGQADGLVGQLPPGTQQQDQTTGATDGETLGAGTQT